MTVSFSDHVELFDQFLTRRSEIVERIEQHLLNVQGKDTSRRRDRQHFESLLQAGFFALPGLSPAQSRLKGVLAARHLDDGFEPIAIDRYTHELDPLELVPRAYDYWNRHRWPGRSGRLTYAGTIYSVFMLCQLQLLSLRLWDDGTDSAQLRLIDVQQLLDRLNSADTSDIFVRDARWLMQTAQGTLTRQLQPYFIVAGHIAGSFTPSIRTAIHAAGAVLAGGHLRSQLRYRVWETGLPSDHPDVLAVTRNSNSMDGALLIGDLVPLLEAYERALSSHDEDERLDLADSILQGLSADPELFVTRFDLAGPLTTIEELFIAQDADGAVRHTTMGAAHVERLHGYRELIGRLAAPLLEDAEAFEPAGSEYSPFGIVYGFVADLLSNMAHARLVGAEVSGLTLEDTFVSRDRLDAKLARATRWAKLPTREGEREHFEHSAEWAHQMFARLTSALDARARKPRDLNASNTRSAQVFVSASTAREVDPSAVAAQDHLVTSDIDRAHANGMMVLPKSQIVRDRQEGRFLASAVVDGHWVGLSKVLLTVLTSRGLDTTLTAVPPPLVNVLRVTCPDLIREP